MGVPIYEKSKSKKNMSLTPIAVAWLEMKRQELGARSLSDVIEKLARM